MAREPNYRERDDFLICVKVRDENSLRRLVNERLPDVVWGSVYKLLSDEEREWAQLAVSR